MTGTPLTPLEAAHLLRRSTFGPFPGMVQDVVSRGLSHEDLVDELLAKVLPFTPNLGKADLPDDGAIDIDLEDTDDMRYYRVFKRWWVRRMASDDAGLHEKMMWFWHGVFTTSHLKVDSSNLCWRQLRTLHKLALGDFGTLLHDMTVDGAMLRFLDGDGSVAQAPNENYGREVMELFTLGLGHYTQKDVEAGSKALAGWKVIDDLTVHFQPQNGLRKDVPYLTKKVRDVNGVVDAILAQKACAEHVVGRIWEFFVGGDRDASTVESWAESFRNSGYQIKPLVRTVFLSEEFRASTNQLVRTPIEWYCATVRAAGVEGIWLPAIESLGQVPYEPPNVSGWPGGRVWLTTTQQRSRAELAMELTDLEVDALGDNPDLVEILLDRASIHNVSDATRAALTQLDQGLTASATAPEIKARTLLTAVVLCPEFASA